MSRSLVKTLGLPDLTLFTVSAIVLLDTLASSAAIGPSSLFWWLFLGLVFLLPLGLITAELGTRYPEEGGLYIWIRRAFGERWGTRAVWAYWINTAIWLPAIFILFSNIAAQLLNIELPITAQIWIGISLAWFTALMDILGLKASKWIPNIGALLKILIFSILIFGGWYYGLTHERANIISLQSIKPSLDGGIEYLPGIIYGMLGFELVLTAGGEIKKPQRHIPQAICLSGLIILGLYFFATLGILTALPKEDIDIVEGLLDTLNMFFRDVKGGHVIIFILGMGALFTFFSNGVTWAMGCNRAMAEAAREGQLPAMFGYIHKHHGGPVGAAILMSCVCTGVLLVYGLVAQNHADLFWSLFSFSAVIFMLPYIMMVAAFLKLRLSDKITPHVFQTAGGVPVACLMSLSCLFILLAAITLFLYVPGSGINTMTLGGVVCVLILGEGLIHSVHKRKSNNDYGN